MDKAKKKRNSFKNIYLNIVTNAAFRIGLILFLITCFTMIAFFIIEKDKNSNNVRSLFDSFWYTIVTLTTVGYGDITPVTILGRIVGLSTMAFGVIFVAAVTGKIASFLVDQQLRRGKGLLKLKKLQNHFIICGWKNDFEKIIDGIIEANPEFDITDIVLINNTSTEFMELFMTNPKYKLLNYIHGDFIDESVLMRANIKSANRVCILADTTAESNPIEIDSRTVMAVMTIEKINRNIYTIAELLDEKFEKYLEMAHCDEVILTKQYERILLFNASSGSGVSHVIRDLLRLENIQRIIILDIPKSYIGVSFKNAFDYYNKEKKAILIGILENTGNFYARKKEALNEAQKTPDISKIVDNLQKVKELKANSPVLNPGFDYIIKQNSMAIVVGRSV
ncbi:MAG: NAD-binding protein [Spirochaetes bacterium]|nr:NAD-binding protein [Spirochaetota bacterium]